MRVGVDGRVLTDRYPGIGRALYSILPLLVGGDDDVVVIRGPESESDRFPISELTGNRLEIHDVPVGLRSVAEQFRLPAEVGTLGLDVVLTPYFATALRWPCPRVTIVHDLIPLTVNGAISSGVVRLGYRIFLRAALTRSQLIVVPSQATADNLLRVYPRFQTKISVVPNAIDAGFRPTGESAIEAVRSRHELGSSYVLTVAGDRPHKNLTRLTAAWKQLDPCDRGEVVLVLVGSPPPRVDHPAIRVLGAVPDRDLPALYTGALAVAVPSLEEGFGLPAAEAMACGTAVICSDRPALREVAGDEALFFDPTDRDAIGEALTRVLTDDDLRRDLSRRGSLRIARFCADLVATRLLEELRGVAQAADRTA